MRKNKYILVSFIVLVVMFGDFPRMRMVSANDYSEGIKEIIQENVEGDMDLETEIANEIDQLDDKKVKDLKENLEVKNHLTQEEEAILHYINDSIIDERYGMTQEEMVLSIIVLISCIGGFYFATTSVSPSAIFLMYVSIFGVITVLYGIIYRYYLYQFFV